MSPTQRPQHPQRIEWALGSVYRLTIFIIACRNETAWTVEILYHPRLTLPIGFSYGKRGGIGLAYTNSKGGIGISWPIGFHKCNTPGWLLTYSLSGGWYWITHSAGSQKKFFTYTISFYDGIRFGLLATETEACSQSPLSETMTSNFLWLSWQRIRKAPLFP